MQTLFLLSSSWSRYGYTTQKNSDDGIFLILMIVFAFLGFVGFCIFYSYRQSKNAEKELNRRLEQSNYERIQQERKWEEERVKRRKEEQYEQSLIRELESELSKLELSRKNSKQAKTLEKHIDRYSEYLSNFRQFNSSYAYLVNSRYTKPLEWAHNKLEKLERSENQQLSHKSAKSKKPTQRSRSPEREKLTKSLRYDILARDNFRCCICGRSANDGVTLHVDHIFPISKGGKTEPANLRTLCNDCNIGKGAKLESSKLFAFSTDTKAAVSEIEIPVTADLPDSGIAQAENADM